ncbi:hypothetical protein LINPERHAP2_LOCUS23172 [Linum perenne]
MMVEDLWRLSLPISKSIQSRGQS